MPRNDPRAVFSRNFQAVMHDQGIRQHHLADELDVSRATVNRWANGHALPKPDELLWLAERLNWSYSAMFAEPGEEIDDYNQIIEELEALVDRLKG